MRVGEGVQRFFHMQPHLHLHRAEGRRREEASVSSSRRAGIVGCLGGNLRDSEKQLEGFEASDEARGRLMFQRRGGLLER